MSIRDDVEELRGIWAKGSWPTRLFFLLSFFLTASSITSLSDVVFGWKGFILDGVEFYRTYITGTLRSLAAILSLEISRQEADFLVLFILWVESTTQSEDDFRTRLYFKLGACALLLFIFWNFGNTREEVLSDFAIWLVPFLYLLGAWMICSGYAYDPATSWQQLYRYLGVPGYAVAFVLVLAAIQEGLMREVGVT